MGPAIWLVQLLAVYISSYTVSSETTEKLKMADGFVRKGEKRHLFIKKV